MNYHKTFVAFTLGIIISISVGYFTVLNAPSESGIVETAFGGAVRTTIFRVASSTDVFNQTVPANTIVFDVNQNSFFRLTETGTSTQSLSDTANVQVTASAAASSTIIKLDGVVSNTGVPTIDFNTAAFNITESPTDEFNLLGLGEDVVSSSTLNVLNWTNGYLLQASTTATGGFDWVSTTTLGITAGGGGTVTSVAASVPTGWTIGGSPITTSGTLAFDYDTGYAAVLTASTTNWNSFYDTPSTRITAGTGLSWTTNTLNAEVQSSDLNSYLLLSDWFGTTTDQLTQGSTNLYNQTHTGEVTGATALTIADNIVDEANLLIGAPTNGYLLTASSSATGGWEWTATTSNNLGLVQLSDLHDAVTLAGSLDYLTISGQIITRNAIDLTTDVTGVLPDANVADNITLTNITQITNRSILDTTGTLTVARGGTGATTFTDGGILLGSGTGAITALGVATNGQIPIGDGTTDPVLATITGGTNLTTVNGAGSITLNVDDAFLVNNANDTTSGILTVGGIDLGSLGNRIDLDADNDTSIRSSSDDNIVFELFGADRILWTTSALTFNDTGLSMDFIVEGDTVSNLFTVDGSADRVGIASSTPHARFGITGSGTGTDNAFLVADGNNAPLFTVQSNGSTTVSAATAATSSVYIYSTDSGKGGAIILEDTDGAGCTQLTTLNGVGTFATVTCPPE